MTESAGEESSGRLHAHAGDADRRRKDRVEFIAAVLIGVAAVLTAVATYQGGDVDGKVAEQQTESLSLTLKANDAYNAADAQQAIERDWFFSWITEVQNETPAADYLETAMPSPVFALAEEWFTAEDDIADPFSAEAAVYRSYSALPSVGLYEIGGVLEAAAECATFRARVFDLQGENFGLSTVFLAISLVVGGIAALLRSRIAQYIVLITAVASLLLGTGFLLLGTDEADARLEVAPVFFSLDDQDQPLDAGQAVVYADSRCPPGN